MIVDTALTVSAAPSGVFDALLDLERLVPCLPGGRLDALLDGGSAATGQVRLPVGRGSVNYRGTIRISEADRSAGAATISVDVRELRGDGRVRGTMRVRVYDTDGATTASLRGTIELSGRAGALAPDAMRRTAAALAKRFANALETIVADSGHRAPRRRNPANDGLEAAIRALENLEAPPHGEIRGVVRIMTDGPIEMPMAGARARTAKRQIAEHPWLVAAGVGGCAALLLLVLLHDRDDETAVR